MNDVDIFLACCVQTNGVNLIVPLNYRFIKMVI